MLLGGTNIPLARTDAESVSPFHPTVVPQEDLSVCNVGSLLPASENCLLQPRFSGALPAETSVSHSDHKSLQLFRPQSGRSRLRIALREPLPGQREACSPFRPSDYYVFTLRRILV